MDRTREEMLAVGQVNVLLLKHGVFFAEPFFDILGGDSIGFTIPGEKAALFRIQVKYRDTTGENVNVVVIPQEYVESAFVLFLNLKTKTGEPILCLLPDEIKKYAKPGKEKDKDIYRLRFTEECVSQITKDASLTFNAEKVAKINELAEKSSPASAILKEYQAHAAEALERMQAQELIIRLQGTFRNIAIAKKGKELTAQFIGELDGVLTKLKEKMGSSDGEPEAQESD